MRSPIPALALVAAAALALSACSGSSSPAPSEDTDGLTPITVGVMPIVDVAAIYVGVEQGFFEEEGLDVSLELAQGGAAIVPAVVSGDYQFGFSNVTSLLLGVSNGVPIQAVSAANFTTGSDPDIGAVVVPEGSPITTAADLAGKTVAVNTLNNIGDSTVRNVVEKDGGDPAKIQFTEMGFPDMPAAIASEQVDAAWILAPHLTRAVAEGARVISWNYAETDPDLMISAYFTSTPYAAEHPEIVESFTSAMRKSLEYADANPDVTRATLDSYTEIDPEIKETMTLPRFKPDINTESVQLLADLALRYGMVDEAIDVSQLLPR
ncbi:ABC transporter substrate-binding protein [Leucobacter luti]|uniref:NitT/TauT family transport system substrate-binding protein n=1 Tax=Leucobacter luti TaxID=340320 RepID=A0A4Q7TZX5_9MICO|nr:ABC transporter substrate-binding protein [Leucobacter luti]MBL3699188.1 nitrate ABC transporter substrate-binding protein [Leucobacter luti]RZT66686.1 NitT/TauT family transport system substrate-binding protein [Leucobacter luti]